MNVEQLGVEDLKQLFDFGYKFGKDVSVDLEDKKISFQEGLALVSDFMQVPDLWAKKDSILAQAEDLSLDEVNQLIVDAEGQFTKQNVIDTIHDCLNWLVSSKNLYERFSHKKAA